MDPIANKDAQEIVSEVGYLIVLTGNHSGRRLPLKSPLTFVGRAGGCDVRLNGKNVDELHCLLAHSPAGLTLRDLNTANGTTVNGSRVTSTTVKDGDIIVVGPWQLRLELLASERDSLAEEHDALRVQTAAVAAQQAALGEEELRLQERFGALEQQREQLSTHLEDKRQRLVNLSEKVQAERAALHSDRVAYEKYVDQVTNDLSHAQRELVDNQRELQAERRRLTELHRRLKKRWERNWSAEQRKLALREEELENEKANLEAEHAKLQQREESVHQDRLHFNAEYELGRRRLADGWARLRETQQKWRLRRQKERAALKVREDDLAKNQELFVKARAQLDTDRETWQSHRSTLRHEVDGLNNRVSNLRRVIGQQKQQIEKLRDLLKEKAVNEQDWVNINAITSTESPEETTPDSKESPSEPNLPVATPLETATESDELPDVGQTNDIEQRRRELEQLAGELADQRAQITEQWQRLLSTQRDWQAERGEAAAEFEALAAGLHEQEKKLQRRDETRLSMESSLRQKHEELSHLRQQLVGWRAKLRAEENTWESKQRNALAELRSREELAEQHLQNLSNLQQRWSKRRQDETRQLKAERQATESLRREYAALRNDVETRQARLEEEKRVLAEKSLAIEQYRQTWLTRGGEGPAAERRIERLRRRWVTQNAAAIQAATQERERVQAELSAVDEKWAKLQQRAEEVKKAEAELAERRTAWEHKQILAAARHARMSQELQAALAQKSNTDQELVKLRDEFENVARALLDDPEPPELNEQAA